MITRSTHAASRAAFTLMEMLVVVAIIVVLAGAAVVAVPAYLDGAKRDRAKTDCKTLEKVITGYTLQNPDFPLQDGDWTQLMTAGQNQRALIEQSSIIDPWGNRYQWTLANSPSPTGRPKVWSTGPPGGQQIDNLNR